MYNRIGREDMMMSAIKWSWHSSLSTAWIVIAGIFLRLASLCNVRAESHIQILNELNAKDACTACGQTEWVTGEYPCLECGRPTIWDENLDLPHIRKWE